MRALVVGWLVVLASCIQAFGLERDPERCSPGRPFAAGTEVPIGGSYSVEAARFTPAQNQAYLSLCPASGDKTKCDLYSSPFLEGAFTAFTKLPGVSDATHYDSYPTITADGSFLLFGSQRTSPLRVWVAAAQNGSFDQPTLTPLVAIAGMQHSNEPYLLTDGRTLYLSGQSPQSQADDIYRTSGDPPLFGGDAVLVPGIATTSRELAPVVSDDEREIFFSSDRDSASFALDIYVATRDTADQDFATPTPVPALSTDGNDWPIWLSPDACDLYYVNKDPTTSVATMYVTHR
jgi:Tol biopolymer transport system component